MSVRHFFWRKDKSICLTLNIVCNNLSNPHAKRVFATIKDKTNCFAVVLGHVNLLQNHFRIVTFSNKFRSNKNLRRLYPLKCYKNIAAWLLLQTLLFLFPSKIFQKRATVSLLADGILLDDAGFKLKTHNNLVFYYEKIGFVTYEEVSNSETQMQGNVANIVQKIKVLLM